MAVSDILGPEDWEYLTPAEKEEVARLLMQLGKGCLWPAPYRQITQESAFRFLTECWWTDNEADREIALIPKKEFVWEFCGEWVESFKARRALLIEKSRRIIVSWMCRGLETWVMGIQRGSWIIIDQTHPNAAEHLWRIHFSLTEMYERRQDMKLQKHDARGAVLIKEPTHVILPNGSILTQGYQDAGSAQGKGKTGITLEEISKYSSPSSFWGQALIVTQGKATGSGGWVCGIANANPGSDWRSIKGGVDARGFLGLGPIDPRILKRANGGV